VLGQQLLGVGAACQRVDAGADRLVLLRRRLVATRTIERVVVDAELEAQLAVRDRRRSR
jgi:hypothetical protein